MSRWPEHIPGTTVHARKGSAAHSFRYGVDYVLIDPDSPAGPRLFARNRPGFATVRDRDHGGTRGAGEGAAWARRVLAQHGLDMGRVDQLLLLTQPAFLGAVFNPVSFWMAFERQDGREALIAVIAEVNNTFGDRHNYLCALPGFAEITESDTVHTTKVFHVSPFREIAGHYSFRFHMGEERISIRILHGEEGGETLFATLTGPRLRLTSLGLLRAALRRPFGGVRVLSLIYWQALRLRLKGARYRTRPEPPIEEIT